MTPRPPTAAGRGPGALPPLSLSGSGSKTTNPYPESACAWVMVFRRHQTCASVTVEDELATPVSSLEPMLELDADIDALRRAAAASSDCCTASPEGICGGGGGATDLRVEELIGWSFSPTVSSVVTERTRLDEICRLSDLRIRRSESTPSRRRPSAKVAPSSAALGSSSGSVAGHTASRKSCSIRDMRRAGGCSCCGGCSMPRESGTSVQFVRRSTWRETWTLGHALLCLWRGSFL